MEKLVTKIINNKKLYFYNCELEDIDENIETIIEWCRFRLLPYMTNKTINYNHNSYGLKHICEKELGFYVSNGQIKKALAILNVEHYQSPSNPNCNYPILESFYNQLSSNKNNDVYTIAKEEVIKIAYKDDVDIIYTENRFIVCKKGTIKDFGKRLAYVYDNKKGKSE